MSNFFNSFLRQVATGDTIKDYQHAARLFVDGVYRLAPKNQTLFHVFIDLSTEAQAYINRDNQVEIGMLAKNVALPKFSVQTKTLNAYNRKTINQERINYDPVSITFHDDSADVVREFWYKYYAFYYRDSDHTLPIYDQPHKYNLRQEQNWGFSPLQRETAVNFISSIRIYSLHQKSFSAYIFVRPTITSFQHGEHTAGQYDPMEHNMTFAYEAVQYEAGEVSNNTVLGFSEIHYDNSPSPLTSIGGGTRSILGPGGLIEGGSDFIRNLSSGNFVGAALGGIRTANNARNLNLGQTGLAELKQVGLNILRGNNPTSQVFVPTAASIKDALSKAGIVNPGSTRVPSNTTGLNALSNEIPRSGNQGIIDT